MRLRLSLALLLLLATPLLAAGAARNSVQEGKSAEALPSHAGGHAAYTMMLATNRAGSETVTTDGNTRTVEFTFNDRGRGPLLKSVITVDANGIPTSIRTTGNDYMKNAVDETFATKNGVATWKSSSEAGELRGGGFYVSADATPEEGALLAAALLRAADHRLALLPAGEAAIRKVGEQSVTSGGATKHITLYEITGLGFDPQPVWLEDDGNFFAAVSSWSQLVLSGWESTVAQLMKAQQAAEDVALADQAKRLTHKPANGILAVTNARLFDPATLKVTPNTTIVVRGNRIEAVGTDVPVPEGATRIDAGGKTVIPGLWDMHEHFSTVDGLLDLANGITTGRDMANDTDFLLDLRKKFDQGTAVGPRIIMAGIIDGPGQYAGPTKVLVSTPEQALAAVDNYAKLGYVQAKIYSSVDPKLVPIIAKRAHEHGMRVSGHVPAFMRAEDAIRDGYDEIQHVNFMMLEFMPDVKETRNPARFIEPAKRGAALDLNSPEFKAFLDLMLQHHTVLDPTLDVFEEMFTARKGAVSPVYATVADRLPPQVRRSFLAGGLPVPDGMDATYRASFKKMQDLVLRLYKAGVPIVAGTDAVAGFAYHRELELYAQAGIPAPEVLRIATLGAATVMHREKELGSVTPGKLADFDIIDGDPVSRISDIRRVVTTVKDGNVFSTAELNRELGVK